jgi:predicted nucleic acid-binding protein
VILVDTAPLVAICDARDSLHNKALKHLARLVSSGFCVCEAVLVEACFHLPNRNQRERLAAVVEQFSILSLPTHETAFRQAVFSWLHKYADHAPNWADGCIAVLCERDERLKVWTYDGEFRATWRKPNGKAIPLALRR